MGVLSPPGLPQRMLAPVAEALVQVVARRLPAPGETRSVPESGAPELWPLVRAGAEQQMLRVEAELGWQVRPARWAGRLGLASSVGVNLE